MDAYPRSPSPHVEGKRARRREEIADVALGLIQGGGIEAFTVQNLAAHLGLTPGALYRYFPSMEELLAHVQRRSLASLEARIRSAVSKKRSSADQLRTAAYAYLESTRVASHETMLISQMLADPHLLLSAEKAQKNAPAVASLLVFVSGLISDAHEEAGQPCENAFAFAVQMWAALHGAVLVGKLSHYESELFDAVSLGRRMVDDLFRAWSLPLPKAPSENES